GLEWFPKRATIRWSKSPGLAVEYRLRLLEMNTALRPSLMDMPAESPAGPALANPKLPAAAIAARPAWTIWLLGIGAIALVVGALGARWRG
ncbi:MAG TPA: hypothetical protein VNC50_09020, partial [Planctomycetia bacterium]|nr:hypothetical protein [Planctomycetia bacterium]